jgi:hypothetical protein
MRPLVVFFGDLNIKRFSGQATVEATIYPFAKHLLLPIVTKSRD